MSDNRYTERDIADIWINSKKTDESIEILKTLTGYRRDEIIDMLNRQGYAYEFSSRNKNGFDNRYFTEVINKKEFDLFKFFCFSSGIEILETSEYDNNIKVTIKTSLYKRNKLIDGFRGYINTDDNK